MPASPMSSVPLRTGASSRSTLSSSGVASRSSSLAQSATAKSGDALSKSAIYVNGLPNNATEADIVEAFKDCGGIKMVNARHVASGGFAFVFFDTDTGAESALARSLVKVKGKQVNV